MSEAKLAFVHVNHRESVNDNQTQVVTFSFRLVVFKLCSNDFKNIGSLNNVLPRPLVSGLVGLQVW